jgi:hypothetical protein
MFPDFHHRGRGAVRVRGVEGWAALDHSRTDLSIQEDKTRPDDPRAIPHFRDPDDILISRIFGDDIAQASGHSMCARSKDLDHLIPLPGCKVILAIIPHMLDS